MKNGNESCDVLGDSRKRYRGPWAEIGKYGPGEEPIRLKDSLPCPLKKINFLTLFIMKWHILPSLKTTISFSNKLQKKQ